MHYKVCVIGFGKAGYNINQRPFENIDWTAQKIGDEILPNLYFTGIDETNNQILLDTEQVKVA